MGVQERTARSRSNRVIPNLRAILRLANFEIIPHDTRDLDFRYICAGRRTK